MLPVCQDCQDKFTTELNLNTLVVSLSHINENIEKTLEANHKLLTNFNNLSATHDETLKGIEEMLQEINKSVSNVTSTTKISTAEIKNTISSLIDTPPAAPFETVEAAAKSAATAVVAEMTTTTTSTAHSISQLPELITALKNDLADSHTLLACQVQSHMEEIANTLSSSTCHCHAKPVTDTHENLADELLNAEKPISGWRFLGTIKKWKPDWTAYDEKQQRRAAQQKVMDKAVKQRKRRKNSNNHNHRENGNERQPINNKTSRNSDNDAMDEYTNSDIISNNSNTKNKVSSDKEMLTIAKDIFSGNPKFINFQQGETINPYRAEKPIENAVGQESPPFLDPMRPPIVRLTQQSAAGDRRFLNARLRDPKIMNIVRTYLSYLHDQPPAVCINGTTKISAITMLAAEGLPTDTNFLREIFFDVHNELGISRNDAMADLQSHRAFLSSERTQRLQRTREAALKFYSPQNFQRH